MKLPPAMVELFLRSSGAPPAMIELIKKVQAEGFAQFATQPAESTDPAWALFGEAQGARNGFVLRAKSPTSRAVIGIYLEGVNDEVFKGLDSLCDTGKLGVSGA
jgi:hypothetical protein